MALSQWFVIVKNVLMMIFRASVSGGVEFLPTWYFLLFSSVSHCLLLSIILNSTVHPWCSFQFIRRTHQNFLEVWHVTIWHPMIFAFSVVVIDYSLLPFSNPQLLLASIIIIRTLWGGHFSLYNVAKKTQLTSISSREFFFCIYLH